MKAIIAQFKHTAICLLAFFFAAASFDVGLAQAPEPATEAENEATKVEEQVVEQAAAETVDITTETDDMVSDSGTIVAVLTEQGNYTWLVGALKETGLDKSLAGDGPFTVFAPTDEAVAAEDVTLESMDHAALVELLRTHLLIGEVSQKQAASIGELATVQGASLSATMSEDAVQINGATIVEADVRASNGVIHGIDAVLMASARGTAEHNADTGS